VKTSLDLSGTEFTVYRWSRKTKRHTDSDDLATIQAGSSLPFGARLRRRRIQRNGYLRKCEIFLETYRSMINHHGPKFYTDHRHSTLENICSFVKERLSKSKAIPVMFNRADGVKINEYRERLIYAKQKFEVRPSVN
jgi:hypothetical protein